MNVGFTGHRPNRLYGYTKDIKYKKLKEATESILKYILALYDIKQLFTGGALGFDFMCFNLGEILKREYNFKNELCLPFQFYGNNWYSSSRAKLEEYKKQADMVHYTDINADNCTISQKLQIRNEFIVNVSDIIIACWDGKEYGGTYNCIEYAKKKDKMIFIINPYTYEVKEYQGEREV